MTISVHSDAPERGKVPLRQRRPHAAVVTEFDAALTTLGIKQRSAAQWFRTSERNIRRWKSGTRKTPPGVMVTVRLMMAGKIGPADVELAAASIPARTNGDANLKPLTPPPIAAASPQPASSLAEKVFALASGTCRWPCGDLGHLDFHFCGSPIVKESYCERHHVMAHMAVPARTTRSPVTWRHLAFPSSPSSSLPVRQDHTR
jgi:hypothetical protein